MDTLQDLEVGPKLDVTQIPDWLLAGHSPEDYHEPSQRGELYRRMSEDFLLRLQIAEREFERIDRAAVVPVYFMPRQHEHPFLVPMVEAMYLKDLDLHATPRKEYFSSLRDYRRNCRIMMNVLEFCAVAPTGHWTSI